MTNERVAIEQQTFKCYWRRTGKARQNAMRAPDEIEKAFWPWGGPVLCFFTVPSIGRGDGLRAKIGFWNYHGAGYQRRVDLYEQFKLEPREIWKSSLAEFRDLMDAPYDSALRSDWAAFNGGYAEGTLREGIFFNSKYCNEKEIQFIKAYCKKNDIGCADLTGFIHCALYKDHIVKGGTETVRERKLVCAPDLESELSAISSGHAVSKDRRGFTLKFCDCDEAMARGEKRNCKFHMKVAIKSVGSGIAFQPLSGFKTLRFLSLSQASDVLGMRDLENGALDRPRADLGIDGRSIGELRGHADAIWEFFRKARDQYREYALDTELSHLFSGGSIAKAMFRKFGISTFLKQNPAFDPDILGKFSAASVGGRVEVKIKGSIVEVTHLDFSSQYPAVFSLMGAQDLLIADKIQPVMNDRRDIDFLAGADYATMFRKSAWKNLRGIALIRPSGDVLTIGLSNGLETAMVESGPPFWTTFADVIAARILGCKTPEILETISLRPDGTQEGLQAFDMFGQEECRTDPRKDDIFIGLARAREVAKKAERPCVAGMIKIVMNSGGFGIFGQTNLDTRQFNGPLEIFCGGASIKLKSNRISHSGKTIPIEDPGEFFSPIFPLVTGGGRLLLAMTEKAGADRGLDYAMCDTDAMAFVRPDGMARDRFHAAIQEISNSFEAISPYEGTKKFLKIEDRCFSLKRKDEYEPLFFLGLGNKRYAEFNVDHNGTPVIRHAAVIALGDVCEPPGYDPEEHEFTAGRHPAGLGDDVCNATAARLIMDVWRHVIRLYLSGREKSIGRDLGKIPALRTPCFAELEISSKEDLDAEEALPWIRPFMPLLRIPGEVDGQSYNAVGLSAWEGEFCYPRDREFLIDHFSGKLAKSPCMKKLSARLSEYFEPVPPETKERRRIRIGAQFVVPKNHRTIRPQAQDGELEAGLDTNEFGSIFKIDGAVLKAAQEPENVFLKLKNRKLLKRFMSKNGVDNFDEECLIYDLFDYIKDCAAPAALLTREEFVERAKEFLVQADKTKRQKVLRKMRAAAGPSKCREWSLAGAVAGAKKGGAAHGRQQKIAAMYRRFDYLLRVHFREAGAVPPGIIDFRPFVEALGDDGTLIAIEAVKTFETRRSERAKKARQRKKLGKAA
jgi:hypothetical protein